MEYGAEILRQVGDLKEAVGGLKAKTEAVEQGLERLREDVANGRRESSDRLAAFAEQIREEIEGVSEQSQRRYEDHAEETKNLRALVIEQRGLVSSCPHHQKSESPAKVDGKLDGAKRSALKALAGFLVALGTAVSGWWATHTK